MNRTRRRLAKRRRAQARRDADTAKCIAYVHAAARRQIAEFFHRQYRESMARLDAASCGLGGHEAVRAMQRSWQFFRAAVRARRIRDGRPPFRDDGMGMESDPRMADLERAVDADDYELAIELAAALRADPPKYVDEVLRVEWVWQYANDARAQ